MSRDDALTILTALRASRPLRTSASTEATHRRALGHAAALFTHFGPEDEDGPLEARVASDLVRCVAIIDELRPGLEACPDREDDAVRSLDLAQAVLRLLAHQITYVSPPADATNKEFA